MSRAVTPTPVSAPAKPRAKASPAGGGGGQTTGPLPKIALFVICVVWMVPAFGLLIT